MLEAIGSKISNSMYYRLDGQLKCSNCGRVVENVKIPKGVSIKQFLKEKPCKKCGVGNWIKTKGK